MAFGKPMVLSISITPAALGASITTQEQAFTINTANIEDAAAYQGLTFLVGDHVAVTPPSGYATLTCSFPAARISTAGAPGTAQVTLIWANLTAAAPTPSSGTYVFHVQRF